MSGIRISNLLSSVNSINQTFVAKSFANSSNNIFHCRSADWSGLFKRDNRLNITYNHSALYNLRRGVNKPGIKTLAQLKSAGLLNYRGCRAGRNKQRAITTIIVRRFDKPTLRPSTTAELTTDKLQPSVMNTQRKRVLTPIVRASLSLRSGPDLPKCSYNTAVDSSSSTTPNSPPVPHVSLINTSISNTIPNFLPVATAAFKTSGSTTADIGAPPSLYVLNASSLAKPHALQQLQADLTGYAIDIAIISETHFKKKHIDSAVSIDDYNLARRDREGRRGGGVAAYVHKDIRFLCSRLPPINRTLNCYG